MSRLKLAYLVILNFAAHDPEGVVPRVVIDVDSAETRGTSSRNPFLVGVVVHHDGSTRLTDTLLTVNE